MNAQRGLSHIFLLVLIFLVTAIITGIYFLKSSNSDREIKTDNSPVATPSIKAQPSLNNYSLKESAEGWITYESEYGFSLSFPKSWEVEKETQIMRDGDLVSIVTVGETQKDGTEFYDGARLTVGIPQKTNKNALDYAKKYHGEVSVGEVPNEFSQAKFGDLVFQKVYTCGHGCFTYYHIKNSENIYSINTFADGPNEAGHKETLNKILNSFVFK